MKLATWNINSLKARLPRVRQFLDELRPDVLCLQETKLTTDAFPHAELAEAGYVAADHSGGRWAGVAILAPETTPPADVTHGLPGDPDADEHRWVEAQIGGMRVASVYVPNGRAVGTPTFEAKLRFLDAMRERVAALLATGSAPLMVAGDFNVTRSDLDVYDPVAFASSTHVTPQERSRLESILDLGLVDAFRLVWPEWARYTWWDYRAGDFPNNRGLRIDYAMLTHDLAARIKSCDIARDFRKGSKPSDHAPLVVELEG